MHFLRPFFLKMPDYSNFQISKKGSQRNLQNDTSAEYAGEIFIDSMSLPVCKNVRHATHPTFRGMAQWAHSSISITFGLKMHIVAMKDQKIVGFTPKRGNLYDITCAEELLYGC
jgi:hypothetical protein